MKNGNCFDNLSYSGTKTIPAMLVQLQIVFKRSILTLLSTLGITENGGKACLTFFGESCCMASVPWLKVSGIHNDNLDASKSIFSFNTLQHIFHSEESIFCPNYWSAT